MPQYQYRCDQGHLFERRGALGDAVWLCPRCGDQEFGFRVPFYRDQYISCETGPKGGLKVEPPREEKSYRHQFKEFQEASQEAEYAYDRAEVPENKRPNYFKRGVKEAKKKGAKIASN